MEQFKKAKVVMLSTNETSKIGNLATYQGRSLAKVIKEGVKPINTIVQFWNLYIISDDKITSKKLLNTNDYYYIRNHYNEWYIGKFNGVSFDFINNDGNFDSNLFVCKKIIATTNASLDLPQPSKQFIEKYIEEYNKGNVITDVLVEYELISNEEYFGNTVNPDNDVPYFDEKLKINPKDKSLNICFID